MIGERRAGVTALLGGLVSFLAAGIMLRGALTGSLALFGSDYMTLNYPLYDWAQRAWRDSREVALWLPQLFGGMPFVGSMNSGMLYPGELVACVAGVPAHRFFAWSALLHEGLAGAGAAWMLSREGFGRGPAVWAGAAYALGGVVFTQLGVADTFTHRAAAWLPWLTGFLLGATRRGWRDGWADAAGASAVLGLLVLTCAVQMIAFGAVFLAILVAADRPGPARRTAGVLAGVAAAGALVGAALLLPALGYYRFSDRPEATEVFANLWALRPGRLLGLVLPGVWGRTAIDSVYFGPYESDNTSVYPGMIPAALAVAGLALAWRRRAPWLIAAVVAVVLAFGGATPAGRALQSVPVFGSFRGWSRWVLFANLAFAVFAAEGWTALSRRPRPWVAPAVLAVLSAATLAAWVGRDRVTGKLIEADWAAERIRSGAVVRPAAEKTIRRALGRAATVAPASLALCLAAVSPALPAVAGGALTGIVAAADLAQAARPFLELGPVGRLRVFDPLGEYLDAQGGLFRVVSEEHPTQKNLRIQRDVDFLWGYHGVPPRALYRFSRALRESGYPRGLLAVMNVRYYVTREAYVAGDLKLIGSFRTPEGGIMHLQEFRDALPRLFFPRAAVAVADEEAALEAMVRPGWDWRIAVLSGPGARAETYAPASATPLVMRPNEREARVTASGKALAVLSVVQYPGWLALLDGVRVPILRADSLIMAVEVPAGVHRLVFRRDPRPFRIGLLLSCMAAAALAGLLGTRLGRPSGPEPV